MPGKPRSPPKRPSQDRLHPEDVEELRGDHAGLHTLRGGFAQQQKNHGVILDDGIQCVGALAVIREPPVSIRVSPWFRCNLVPAAGRAGAW